MNCVLAVRVYWLPWQQDRKSLSQPFENIESSSFVYGLPVDSMNHFLIWLIARELVTMAIIEVTYCELFENITVYVDAS